MSNYRWVAGPMQSKSYTSPAPPSTRLSAGAYISIAVAACIVVAAGILYIRRVLVRFNEIVARNTTPKLTRLESTSIAALPAFAYAKPTGISPESPPPPAAAAECCVCLGPMSEGEMVRALPDCGHMFHVGCIDTWLRSRATCPVCRADLSLYNSDSAGCG